MQQASKQMMAFAQRGKVFNRMMTPMMSNTSLMVQQPRRNISLLINDQFLDDDQKMIQQMAYDFAKSEFEPNAAEWDR